MQHGYDYQRIAAPTIPNHYVTWIKITHLYNVIQKYDIVVFLDPDVYIRHPYISIEFLMSRYNFTSNSSLLMALDPAFDFNTDSKKRVTLNTGFIIARNNKLTNYILKELVQCAEHIPNCSEWRQKWSYEQRAFSEYFRDQMKVGTELIIAPCDELNGFEGSESDCSGTFVSHAWNAKHAVRNRHKQFMLEGLLLVLEKYMWEHKHIINALTSNMQKLSI